MPPARASRIGAAVASGSPKSIGTPGLGAAENIALGIVISLVEADVASEAYKKAAAFLNDLLRQVAENGDADESQWRAIAEKLTAIANMKQSMLGYVWEVISYGQGSLQEKQALAMMALASELGEKFGYHQERQPGEEHYEVISAASKRKSERMKVWL